MRFSYTDDAVVSSSPTGRHLSTVIRRPCVLMSGWDEHAAEICKVLNELSPTTKSGATVSSLRDCGYGKIPDVILQNWPKAGKSIDLAPGLQFYTEWCDSQGLPYDASGDLQEMGPEVLAELRSMRPSKAKRWVCPGHHQQVMAGLNAQLNAKDEELDKLRQQLEGAYLDNVEAQRKANAPIYVGHALARVLLNTTPGTTVLHGNRTFQRGS